MFMDNSDKIGEVQSQQTSSNLLVLTKRDGFYQAEFEGPQNDKVFADILNLDGNAAGMKSGSYIDFGGDSTKRITVTVTRVGETHLYVEIGE